MGSYIILLEGSEFILITLKKKMGCKNLSNVFFWIHCIKKWNGYDYSCGTNITPWSDL